MDGPLTADDGYWFGLGAFETIRVYRGKAVFLEEHLRRLDRFEGYPSVYRRIWVDVEFEDSVYQAVTYEMAWQTKVVRDRIKYPEEYRLLCSAGARVHNIKNNFTKKRKVSK